MVRGRINTFASTAWYAQGNYRPPDVDHLVMLIVPRVEAGQVQIANLTSAYIAQYATALKGSKVVAVPVNRARVTGGRGVPADEVYRRPAGDVYGALAEGASFRDAVDIGARRLADLVAMDMQMAQVRQAQDSYEGSGIQYFRRVLSGSPNTCELCQDASRERYSVADLMPIHQNCGCTTEQIESSEMSGRVIDSKVEVRDHGEYGPVLTVKGQDFTGPQD